MRRTALATGLPILAYAVLAELLYWPLTPLTANRLPVCSCGDAVQMSWFLGWDAFAVTHLHQLFYTDAMNFPHGVDLSVNPTMPLLGMLLAPVTVKLGAVASFNLLLHLAFFLSGSAAFLVLRRWVCWTPAAFTGGLFYGFSPYMIGQGLGHANLVFAVVPPLILGAIAELAVGRSWSARKAGLAIGALAAVQYLIAPELLAEMAVLTLVAAAGMAVVRRSAVRAVLGRIRVGLAWSLVVFLPLIAWPAFELFAGHSHISGPVEPPRVLSMFKVDLLEAVIPTHLMRIAPLSSSWIERHGNLVENGGYVGLPLLVLLIVLAVRYRDDGRIRFSAFLALVAFILSLGTTLRVRGLDTGVPLPFEILHHLPVMNDMLASRFSLQVDLFVAVILALGIDHMRDELASAPGQEGHWSRRRLMAKVAAPAIVAALALFPLIPAVPYAGTPTNIPRFFTTDEVRLIPDGSVVLTFPYAHTAADDALLWQMASGYRFRLVGGYATISPGPHADSGTEGPALLYPPRLERVFLDAMLNGRLAAHLAENDAPAVRRSSCSFLRRYRIQTVILGPSRFRRSFVTEGLQPHPQIVEKLVDAVTGERPISLGGVLLWRHAAAACSLALAARRIDPG